MKSKRALLAVAASLFSALALTAGTEQKVVLIIPGTHYNTDPEPLPKGHPLWKFENVIMTPHCAGRSDGERARCLALFKENLRRFGAGEPLIYVVDKRKGY